MTDARADWTSDRQEIADLVHQYCYAVAAGDVAEILTCFTPDARFDVLGQVHEGHTGLRAMYADVLRTEPKPFVHNLVIEPAGTDAAVGRCVAQIIRAADGSSGYGRYDDRFARTADGWRFTERVYARY